MNRASFEELLGALPGSIIVALPLAVAAAWITARRYSLAVSRSMSRSSGTPGHSSDLESARPASHPLPRSELRCDWIDGASPRSRLSGTIADRAETALRRQGIVQWLAGSAHTLTATLLLVGFMAPGFQDVKLQSFGVVAALLFAPTLGAFCLAQELPMRRTLIVTAAYSLGVLLVLAARSSGDRSEFDPRLQTILLAPSVFAALFLNRQFRTLGPFFFLLASGFGLAVVVGVVARRPFGVGSPDVSVAALAALLTFAVIAIVVWFGLRALARSYDRKRTSDLLFRLDVYWLLFTLIQGLLGAGILAGNVVRQTSGVAAATYRLAALLPAFGVIVAFVAYRLVVYACLPWVRTTTLPPPGRTLLLLRVFGFNRRSQRWLEALGARWRYLGGVQLIAAPDLAVTTLDLPELLDFLRGGLSRRFVASSANLEERLSSVDLAPDPDGRYRVTEFLCHADTWQAVVHRLALRVDSVLMDLRSFGPGNRGCSYELRVLLQNVDLDKVVLLVDPTTHRPFLEESLRSAWREIGPDSPNQSLDSPVLRLFATPSDNQSRVVRSLVSHLCAEGPKSL